MSHLWEKPNFQGHRKNFPKTLERTSQKGGLWFDCVMGECERHEVGVSVSSLSLKHVSWPTIWLHNLNKYKYSAGSALTLAATSALCWNIEG